MAAVDFSQIPEDRITQMRATVDQGIAKTYSWRIARLDGILRFLEEQESQILETLRADLGRCAMETRSADIFMVRAEVNFLKRNLRRLMGPQYVRTPLAVMPGRSWIRREPYGLALIFGTWNFPYQQILIPLAGALAAGNLAVAKLSENAPESAALMATELERYLDPEAVVVVGGGAENAARLLQMRFDTILYTGSNRVGRIVMKAAAENLTPVTLELGGKNPALVLEDADLKTAARRIVWGRFMNAGQLCVAPDYVLLPEFLRPKFLTLLQAEIESLYGVDPKASPDFGRIVNSAHFNRLIGMLSEGTVVYGGQHDSESLFIAPTLLTDLPAEAAVLQEEIFGPILPVVGYKNLDEALRSIRRHSKPLMFYLFTKDRSVQDRVEREMSSGSLLINDTILNQIVTGLPFGGVGGSGMGAIHGRFTFDAFSHAKAVVRKPFWMDIDVRYPPFTALKERILQWLMSG